ncbi:MAG: zinc ribbon domain-containing protein [Candidatus Thermoplasmatota archaeon]|nr:zinc ribbon domain-containing protein [Candidatus Thermoplasmatota archaeon]
MTKGSMRIFGCPTCGFRVCETDRSCPRCGIPFSSETRFECPFCGELVDQGSTECPSCRVNYGEFKEKTEARGGDDSIDALLMEIIQLEAQSARTETKKFSCPGCSLMLDSGTERCPRCGRDLTAEEEAFQCPICGAAVSAESDSCPECGSSFEVEEEVAEQAEERRQTQILGAMAATDALEKVADESMVVRPSEKRHEVKAVSRPPEPAPREIAAREEPEPEFEEVEEERPAPEVRPIKVIAKPVTKPRPLPAPEPETVRAEPEPEEPWPPPRNAPPGAPKKTRYRKLKAKTQ